MKKQCKHDSTTTRRRKITVESTISDLATPPASKTRLSKTSLTISLTLTNSTPVERSTSSNSTSMTLSTLTVSTLPVSKSPISKLPNARLSYSTSPSDLEEYRRRRKRRKAWQERRKEARSFYVCFGCVITFVLLMSPSVFVRIYNDVSSRSIPKEIYEMTLMLAVLNPLSDIFIYVWFNVELKDFMIKKLLGKKIHSR